MERRCRPVAGHHLVPPHSGLQQHRADAAGLGGAGAPWVSSVQGGLRLRPGPVLLSRRIPGGRSGQGFQALTAVACKRVIARTEAIL